MNISMADVSEKMVISESSSTLAKRCFLPRPLSPIDKVKSPSFQLIVTSSRSLSSRFFASSTSSLSSKQQSAGAHFVNASSSQVNAFLRRSFISFNGCCKIFPSFHSSSLGMVSAWIQSYATVASLS